VRGTLACEFQALAKIRLREELRGRTPGMLDETQLREQGGSEQNKLGANKRVQLKDTCWK